MIRKFAILLSAALLAFPVWADQQKPLQTIEETYALMLDMVTDYPADIKNMSVHFPNMTANTNIRINQLTTTFDLPQIKDVWRDNITFVNPPIVNDMGKSDLSSLTCNRIGQPTLAHMRQTFFANGITEEPKGLVGMQFSFIQRFAEVPDEAVAMQLCLLHYELPSRKTEVALYQDLLAAIGGDFADTDSAAEMQRLRHENPDKYITYFFKGQGGLRLNGAVVTSLQANVFERYANTGRTPIFFVAIGYLMPFSS